MSEIHIGVHDTGNTPGPGEQTWDNKTLQKDFEVQGFSAPFVAVKRHSDGAEGTLEFRHSPRIYFGFKEN